MTICGHIWTKSKFLGLSICVEMVGETVIRLHKCKNRPGVIVGPSPAVNGNSNEGVETETSCGEFVICFILSINGIGGEEEV